QLGDQPAATTHQPWARARPRAGPRLVSRRRWLVAELLLLCLLIPLAFGAQSLSRRTGVCRPERSFASQERYAAAAAWEVCCASTRACQLLWLLDLGPENVCPTRVKASDVGETRGAFASIETAVGTVSRGVRVLGRTPFYTQVADAIGAKAFNV